MTNIIPFESELAHKKILLLNNCCLKKALAEQLILEFVARVPLFVT